MNKRLSKKIVDKLIGCDREGNPCGTRCTGSEISLLLYLAMLQDICGVVKGVYYKDVIEAIKMSKRYFYICMDALERKGLVHIIDTDEAWGSKEYARFTVQILDNNYESADFKNNPYLSLTYNALHNPAFLTLKRNEKFLVIRILEVSFNYMRKEGGSIHQTRPMSIGYKTMAKWLGVHMRAIKGYVNNIKKVIPLLNDTEKKAIYIDVLSGAFEDVREEKKEQALGKLIGYIAKESRTDVSPQDLDGVMQAFFRKSQGKKVALLNVYKIKYYVEKLIAETGNIAAKMLNDIFAKEESLAC